MKTSDLATIGAAALITATLTVAIFSPDSSGADGEEAALAARIAQPKLVVGGIEITLTAPDQRSFKPGDMPVFELKAVNTCDRPAEALVQAMLTAMARESAGSRMVPMPRTLWQDRCSLTLGPNETKVVRLVTNIQLPANNSLNVFLQPVDTNAPIAEAGVPLAKARPLVGLDPKAVVALSFSTVPPTPLTNAVAVK